MKKHILIIFILVGLGIYKTNAQTKFTTGDLELDGTMSSLTKYSRNNMPAFQKNVMEKYKLSETEFKNFVTKLSGGDMLMVFEIAAVLNKTNTEIADYYIANRIKKSWKEILIELGLSSQQFEEVKQKVGNSGIIK